MTLWTREEINSYRPNKSTILAYMYANNNLPSSDPEARAKYLAESLGFTMMDHDTIMSMARLKGRHVALEGMEEMWVANYDSTPNEIPQEGR